MDEGDGEVVSENLPAKEQPEKRRTAEMDATALPVPAAAAEPAASAPIEPRALEPVAAEAAALEAGDPALDADLRESLKDIGSRLPNYARFSQGLVAAGLLSANQQAQLLGPLGGGPLAQVARFVPLLSQLTRVLQLVGAVHFALTQLDPETAELQLAAAGLTRAQVEADFQLSRTLAGKAATSGGEQAARALEIGREAGTKALEATRERVAEVVEIAAPRANEKLHQGAKRAGRLAGLGVRALRDWQSKSNRDG